MSQRLTDEEIEEVAARVDVLKLEHRDLDVAITTLQEQTFVDPMLMRRMKKRKLFLKDMISKLESMMIPDMPA